MSNRAAATILGMMHGNLVIMKLSVMIIEATQSHLKACAAILHLTLWLVTDEILKVLILGRPCQTPRVAVVPRRGNKKSSLNLNLILNHMLLRCHRSILLHLFQQPRLKSLLPKRKSARGQIPRSIRKKVAQKE